MKIFVGNLPFSVDKTQLEDMFKPFGDIEEATVITNKFSGRSKGFGFVTFKNDEDAKKAIEDMNKKDVEGRTIDVNEAKPFDPDKPRPQRRGGGFQRREHGNWNNERRDHRNHDEDRDNMTAEAD